jgi:hypothetical protein
MIPKAIGVACLLLLPAIAAYVAGFDDYARVAVVGAVLAYFMGSLARPIARFGVLIPVVYAAAAVTANFTDGVAALIVAIAAAAGAASSLGYHRAMLAVLAATLIGSFEPASTPIVFGRALAMFTGCLYGVVLVATLGNGFATHPRAVHAKTALSYSVLLAVLVLIAWFTARAAELEHAWWLPLTVAALGDPWFEGTPRRAVGRLVLALAGTLLVLTLFETLPDPLFRLAGAVVMLVVMLAMGPQRSHWRGFLLTPILVLLVAVDHEFAPVQFLEATALAFAFVAVFTVLGKWVLWTLRPDTGHAAI